MNQTQLIIDKELDLNKTLEFKGKVFSLGPTSSMTLIELKVISVSGLLKRHPVGGPLVFTPAMTLLLWSVPSTWTICPLSYWNLISRDMSIVQPQLQFF